MDALPSIRTDTHEFSSAVAVAPRPGEAVRHAARWIVAAFACATLGGCLAQPLAVMGTANPSVPVELMFEHDGCRVYRFRDAERPVYYTDCRGSTAWEVSCGRNCTRPVHVATTR
jgi:hypothetical protein